MGGFESPDTGPGWSRQFGSRFFAVFASLLGSTPLKRSNKTSGDPVSVLWVVFLEILVGLLVFMSPLKLDGG